jgi:flagellar hook-length control protein FliK
MATSVTPEVKNTFRQTIAQQIIEQMIDPAVAAAQNLSNLETRKISLRLHPAEFGQIDITLTRNASGQLNAHFSAENENARQALTTGINQLRLALEGTGLSVNRLDVNTGQTSQSHTGGQSNRDQSGSPRSTSLRSIETHQSPIGLRADLDNRLLSVRA